MNLISVKTGVPPAKTAMFHIGYGYLLVDFSERGTLAGWLGLNTGEAMDLTTGWDFSLAEHRQQATEYQDRVNPLVLIGSPPCTPFSQLQTLNPDTPRSRELWKQGVEHLKFVAGLYRKQVAEGRVFLHEHPATAAR